MSMLAAMLITVHPQQATPAPDAEHYQRWTMTEARGREYTGDPDADGVVSFDEYGAYHEATFHGWNLDAGDDLALMEAGTCWIVRGGDRESALSRDFDLSDDWIIGYEDYHPQGWWEEADTNANGELEPDAWPEAFQD